MLRIEEGKRANGTQTFRLDGRLVREWVEVLRSSCEPALEAEGRLILDLAGVSFADHAGARLLRQLEARAVTLLNCSPFLREQIGPRDRAITE